MMTVVRSVLLRLVSLVMLACAPSDLLFAQKPKLTPIRTLTEIPAGLTIPIQVNHGLRAGGSKAGSAIVGVTTQRIPLSERHYLGRGAKVIGTVIASTAADPRAGTPAVLTLRFTALSYRGQTVPIVTRAIAIANFTDVDDTQVPANGSTDRGNSNPASWTTRQVGGDVLVRSGWIGELVNGSLHRVGFADYHGIYADPASVPCGTARVPRALGVFSASAKGPYGLEEGAALASSGGEIEITAPGKLLLRNGDNLLLEVLAPK